MISITEASLIVKIPIIQLLLSYFLGQESVKLCKPFPASVKVKMCVATAIQVFVATTYR